ncbi:hypothetical protein BTHE68_19850 [Burkholderia sp. THE68]|nr:hypothetical protein BTHE68_19850 [Burkholderia sp. THE68]
MTVPHDQRAARVAQRAIQLDDARMDERHAAVIFIERRENLAIENEGAQHPTAPRKRVIECSIVCRAKVPPKPHQTHIKVGHLAAPLLKF